MDPSKNWIRLHRNILVNSLWRGEPFTRGQAWVDLLLLANHSDGYIMPRGIYIPVHRGQVGYSAKQLSIRWKWSEGKVNRYLQLLNDLEMILIEKYGKNGAQNGAEKSCVSILITILNYDTYQSSGAQNESETERKRSANESETEPNKKNKKNKKENNIETDSAKTGLLEICQAWKAYVEMRRTIKKPMTDYAMGLRVKDLFKLLAQGHDPVAVLNQSIAANWQDLYPIKETESKPVPTTGQADDLELVRRTLEKYK